MNKKDDHYDFMHAHRCITFAIMKLVRFVGVLLLAGQTSLNIWAGNLTPSQSAEPSVKKSVRLVPTQPSQNTSTPSSSLEPITKPQELAWNDVKEFHSTKLHSKTPLYAHKTTQRSDNCPDRHDAKRNYPNFPITIPYVPR